MSEEEIKKVARETFLENVMKNFDSVVIFEYIQTLERENKKLKNVLKEIREYIKDNISQEFRNGRSNEFYLELNEKNLKILLEIIDKGIKENE